MTVSGIVEANPGKFRLGEHELQERREFVERTRKSVQVSIPVPVSKIFFNFMLEFMCMNVYLYVADEGAAL